MGQVFIVDPGLGTEESLFRVFLCKMTIMPLFPREHVLVVISKTK